MNRIDSVFENLKKRKEKALVGFVTAGDPDVPRSLRVIEAMWRGGLDVLELGVPFSDPTADGPVIQRSSQRALKSGVTLRKVIEMVKNIRKFSEIPVIIFSYYNPIIAYGSEKFYNDATDAGVDGVLIVDLPPEESKDLLSSLPPDSKLAFINLIALTTPKSRMEKIAKEASGFIYLVSMTGVTGSSGMDPRKLEKIAEFLKEITNVPVCVGFGISTPEQAASVCKFTDGVVVGSAFERIVESNPDNPHMPAMVGKLVADLKSACKTT